MDGQRRYALLFAATILATRKLRETMAAERGSVRVFDFGPPAAELKRNCERETGLPAPAWPRFARPASRRVN